MRYWLIFVLSTILVALPACSGGGGNPVVPSQGSNAEIPKFIEQTVPVAGSDVLYTGRETAYKAFGIFDVILDPTTMTAEITPTRKAQAIGTTFDADLTQFLTVNPCMDCLKVNGIRLAGTNQIEVGFAIKHPFSDITKRPDLHVFDVRGIVIANGNYNFALTLVATSQTSLVSARANVSMIANADGWTHHFVELAADPNYFDPPRTYNVNINPYKRYYFDPTTPAFNPQNPAGYNVMKVGAGWETQKYLFNVTPGPDPLNFVFVLDCAYGQSATFQNRLNPYYFLPEFNRKEAWKVNVEEVLGMFQSHNTSSSIGYRVSVCDWQNTAPVDPDYPKTTNLGGISAESDVKSVSIEIPFVSGLVESTSPVSGNGHNDDPYIFNLTVTNSQNAASGNYWGLVAVRDDLQGQQGPMAIPETPAGFPFPGPEIYDYTTYKVFPVRVHGSPPQITGYYYNSSPDEGDFVDISADVTEPDGDTITYHWEQVEPASPVGIFADPNARATVWQAPPLYDVPVTGVQFILHFTATDIDGTVEGNAYLTVYEKNSAPVCISIDTNPYFGIIGYWEAMGFWGNAMDPDGDALKYEWDFDWDGDPSHFVVDDEGQSPTPYTWGVPGFFIVGMRVTESDRTNALSTYCSRDIIVEGTSMPSIKVDNSPDADPGYCDKDIDMIRYPYNNPVFHAAYCVINGAPVMYCNTMRDPHVFGDHQVISRGPTSGGTEYPKVAGYDKFVHVVWTENDTSTVPTTYRIKINTSDNGGQTFEAFGGERTVAAAQNPDILGEADICAGNLSGLFYFVYSYKTAGNYTLWLLASDDGGETWHQPSGGSGAFRDVVNTTYAGMPELEYSPDGVIHVLWRDMRSGGSKYYYDWSSDGGVTWHTDMLVTDASTPYDCAMAVDNVNNAYFAWQDSDNRTYFRKTIWGNPPTMDVHSEVFNLGLSNYHGIDIYVSPLADIIVIPVMYYYSGFYQTTYFYSYDRGYRFDRYLISNYSPNQTDNIVTAGRWENSPGRIELCSIWVDSRTSLAPYNDHIWGEFGYIADRP